MPTTSKWTFSDTPAAIRIVQILTFCTPVILVDFIDICSAQDLVVLRNGTEMTGRITASTAESIELRMPSSRITLNRSQIKKLDRSRPFNLYITYGWALLQKEDFAQAEELYFEGAVNFKTDEAQRKLMLTGLLEVGRGLLSHRLFVDSRRCLEKVLVLDSENAEAKGLLDEAGRMCRKIQKEMEGFLQALHENPDNDFARYHLGLRYESLGENEKAQEEYETILKRSKVDITKFNGLLHMRGFIKRHMVVSEDEAEVSSDENQSGQNLDQMEGLKSPRAVIYHYNRRLALDVVEVVDKVLSGIEEEFNVPSDGIPYTIFVYRDEKEYSEATGLPGSVGFAAGPRKIHLYMTAPRMLKSVLPHELVHATLYRQYHSLPSWVDEGLAVRYEQGPGIYYDRVKQWMQDSTTYPFKDFMKKSALRLSDDKRSVFYGQAYTLVDFLYVEHGGRTKMLEFLRAISQTKRVEASLRQVYGLKSMAELEKQWRKFMEL
ncbi:MAG: hypothetical protein O2857_04455 [Planctomycetota bacterium]|nr:hypothetical protein [Planctomycetota bacterium]